MVWGRDAFVLKNLFVLAEIRLLLTLLHARHSAASASRQWRPGKRRIIHSWAPTGRNSSFSLDHGVLSPAMAAAVSNVSSPPLEWQNDCSQQLQFLYLHARSLCTWYTLLFKRCKCAAMCYTQSHLPGFAFDKKFTYSPTLHRHFTGGTMSV